MRQTFVRLKVGGAHLGIGEHVFEVVIRDEPDAGFYGVPCEHSSPLASSLEKIAGFTAQKLGKGRTYHQC